MLQQFRVLTKESTVKPRYYGHRWDKKKCLCYGVPLKLTGLILKKMYGAGPRKLSVIVSVRIKRVFVERGVTVQTVHCIIIFREK